MTLEGPPSDGVDSGGGFGMCLPLCPKSILPWPDTLRRTLYVLGGFGGGGGLELGLGTFSADGGPGTLSAEDGLGTFLAIGTTIIAGTSLHSMSSKLLFSGRWLDTPPSSSSTRALPNSSLPPPTASLLPTTGDLSWSDAFQPLALLMILLPNLANRLDELRPFGLSLRPWTLPRFWAIMKRVGSTEDSELVSDRPWDLDDSSSPSRLVVETGRLNCEGNLGLPGHWGVGLGTSRLVKPGCRWTNAWSTYFALMKVSLSALKGGHGSLSYMWHGNVMWAQLPSAVGSGSLDIVWQAVFKSKENLSLTRKLVGYRNWRQWWCQKERNKALRKG